jgi:hypothetical protein
VEQEGLSRLSVRLESPATRAPPSASPRLPEPP